MALKDFRAQEDIRNDLIQETIEEEILEALTEALIETDALSSRGTEEREARLQDASVNQLTKEILQEVLKEEMKTIGEEYFDDVIENHNINSHAVMRLNSTVQDVTREMIEEIVLELIETKTSKIQREEILDGIINEVLTEECLALSDKVLDHYRARVALLQYKQMQTSASNYILDTVVLQSLLSQYHPEREGNTTEFEPHEQDQILDDVVLKILLSQSMALHNCFPQNKPKNVTKKTISSAKTPPNCIPIKWYKKKITSAIAEDVVVSLLCDRLDESMQIAADEEIKSQAISLFHQLVDT